VLRARHRRPFPPLNAAVGAEAQQASTWELALRALPHGWLATRRDAACAV